MSKQEFPDHTTHTPLESGLSSPGVAFQVTHGSSGVHIKCTQNVSRETLMEKTSQHIDKTSLFLLFPERELAAAVQSKGAILKWKKGFASS